jgi:Flp pilus assembly protein TadG
MHRKPGLSRIRDTRGNAVVEMALVLPLLLILVFGITEFGRAWMTVNVLQTAAREGARLAVVQPVRDNTAIQNRATAICNAAAIHNNVVVSCVGPINGDIERKVTVTVSADFTVVTGRVLAFRGTVPLSAQCSMRSEGGG